MVLGFDVYSKLNKLRIILDGICYTMFFQSWTTQSNLFSIELPSIEKIKAHLVSQSCADFLTRCSHPLWQNLDFFIHIPFINNEDINPTKTSHYGMSPKHLNLTQQECTQLLSQGLIEPAESQCTCETFYVNKRVEQAREKLRLVINHQPLNFFL